mgnify:FL=1
MKNLRLKHVFRYDEIQGHFRQKKTNEMDTEYDVEVADFEGGYDACIDRARASRRKLEGGE